MRPSLAAICAIVFDMDGVLLLSSSIHEAAYREALRPYPIPNFNYARLAGLRTNDGIRAVLTEHSIPVTDEQLGELAAAKTRIALERIAAENPIAPAAPALLEALAKRYKLGLATSASEASVNAFLDRNGFRLLFQSVLHGGNVRHAKPSPEVYELSFERLGVAPANCLVVEDAVSGIHAAKAAGAAVCGISATCPISDLEKAGADFIITRLEELLDLGGAE